MQAIVAALTTLERRYLLQLLVALRRTLRRPFMSSPLSSHQLGAERSPSSLIQALMNHRAGQSSAASDLERRPVSVAVDERWRATTNHEIVADPVRELSGYFLTRPWVDPNVLMGGLVDRKPDHIARLRELLEADLETVRHCLALLDALQSAEEQTT